MNPLLSAIALTLSIATVQSENWPQWRGPAQNGSSTEKNLPSTFSKPENLKWSVAMPGPSAATPVIWGDHVFVSTSNLEEKAMYAMAIDRKSGKVLWSRKAGEGLERDKNSNYASPSPVTDGKVVIFFYGNGPLVAYDFAGKEIWSRNLLTEYGRLSDGWTFSTSPLLHEGKLIIQVLRRSDPYLLAIEPATGKNIWKVTRDGKAVAESRDGFASPVPVEHKGRKELLVIGCDDLTGHDPVTGKELWRWGTWNPERIGHWRQVPSPAFADGVILACAPKRSPIYAIKAGGNGVLADTDIAWQSEPRSPVSSDVPTPLTYLGDFFVLSEGGSLSRVEPKTGKSKWSIKVSAKGAVQCSPTGADGKIFFQDFSGQTFVVNAEDGALLSTNALGEKGENMIRSAVAIAQGQLFIRTNLKLHCISK